MYRIFSRVKTVDSIRHKLNVKYADKKVKIQDMIQDGFHIGTHIWVIVFVDDVATLVLSACGNTLIWNPLRRDLAELLVELFRRGVLTMHAWPSYFTTMTSLPRHTASISSLDSVTITLRPALNVESEAKINKKSIQGALSCVSSYARRNPCHLDM
jgi:hypothetical protein